jgi:hypothetical protein
MVWWVVCIVIVYVFYLNRKNKFNQCKAKVVLLHIIRNGIKTCIAIEN